MATFTYLEAHEDDALTNFSFDQTGGSCKAYYDIVLSSSTDTLQGVIQDILGYTNPNSGTQYLQRSIPLTHPKYPYLYASKISSLQGKGVGTSFITIPNVPSNPAIGVRPIANYEQFVLYRVGIEFTSRPYPLIADGAFTQSLGGNWYVLNGTANSFSYAPEWVRWCDYDFFTQDNTVQGQQGNMYLLGVPGAPGGNVLFSSPPWMWMPDQILKVNWYQVPYRFITSQNSYIAGGAARNWRGRVNQNAWWNWQAGSLLYLNFNVKKYTPPTTDIGTYPTITSVGWSNAPSVLGSIVNYERLCDIELIFLLTNRYRSGSSGGITINNHCAAGHNLLPNLADNKFYYATRSSTGSADINGIPPWASAPFEVLFSDPDAGVGPTTVGDN